MMSMHTNYPYFVVFLTVLILKCICLWSAIYLETDSVGLFLDNFDSYYRNNCNVFPWWQFEGKRVFHLKEDLILITKKENSKSSALPLNLHDI